MKKIKNLKNTFADQILFTIYMSAFLITPIVLNEGYQKHLELLEKQRLERLAAIEKAKQERLKRAYKVKFVRGKAQVFDIEGSKENPLISELKEDDIIKSGVIVKTFKDSFLILKFGKNSDSHLKLGANTEMELNYEDVAEDDLDEGEDLYDQSASILLKLGSLLFDIKDKYSKGKYKVRTKNAIMGIRGTKFLGTYDSTGKFSIGMKEGKVELTNRILVRDRKELKEGDGFIILADGSEIDFSIEELLPNWDIFDMTEEPIKLDKLDELVEKPKIEKKEKEDKQAVEDEASKLAEIERKRKQAEIEKLRQLSMRLNKMVGEFDRYIQVKQTELKSYQADLEYLISERETKERQYKRSVASVKKDVKCLRSSKAKCNLINKKLLTTRGYPKIIFNAKTKAGMADELEKYLGEFDIEVKKISTNIIRVNKKVSTIKNKLKEAQDQMAKIKSLDLNSQHKEGIIEIRKAAKLSEDVKLSSEVKEVETEYYAD